MIDPDSGAGSVFDQVAENGRQEIHGSRGFLWLAGGSEMLGESGGKKVDEPQVMRMRGLAWLCFGRALLG